MRQKYPEFQGDPETWIPVMPDLAKLLLKSSSTLVSGVKRGSHFVGTVFAPKWAYDVVKIIPGNTTNRAMLVKLLRKAERDGLLRDALIAAVACGRDAVINFAKALNVYTNNQRQPSTDLDV